jgi:2-oxoglutarate ferredoxin oxidoreductase subunit alpha
VLAPTSIADCAQSVEWASRLAEHLQTAAVVLSDQFLGQAQAIIDEPSRCPPVPGRKRAEPAAEEAGEPHRNASGERYGPSRDHISAMPIPGARGLAYVAEGLEHDRHGCPSSRASDHAEQLAKRRDKLLSYDFGSTWLELDRGEQAEPMAISLLTWGSSWGAVREAADTLRRAGLPVQALALRLLAPLQRTRLRAVLGESQVLVIELNQSAQLFRYLHAERALPASARSLARPGPLPLRPAEIINALKRSLEG